MIKNTKTNDSRASEPCRFISSTVIPMIRLNKLSLASVLFSLTISAQAQEPAPLDYRGVHPSISSGMHLPSDEQLKKHQERLRMPSDDQVREQGDAQRNILDRAMQRLSDNPSALKPMRGPADAQSRDQYGQLLSEAQRSFSTQIDEAGAGNSQGQGAAVLGAQGVDKLQQLLRQQEEAKEVMARKMRTGTDAVPDEALMIFVSFSMPEQVLKNLAEQARLVGAVMVLRGMVGGKLSSTQAAALKVNQAGASWEINPEAFTTFDVKTVPAFVLTANKDALDNGCAPDDSGQCSPQNTFSKISGDISVRLALDTMQRRSEIPLIRGLAQHRIALLERNSKE